MQTLNFTIDIPQGKVIDIALVKQKVTNYALQLIACGGDTYATNDSEIENSMSFIESLAVSGGRDIPVSEDSIASLV